MPISSLPDPKRVRGWVYRNALRDPIGCLACDMVYEWSLPKETASDTSDGRNP